MNIAICSRNKVAETMKAHSATHVLSLLDPGVRTFLHPKIKAEWKLMVMADELYSDLPNAPTVEHVKEIIEYGLSLPEDSSLLVHCEAGVSRSTAASLVIMVAREGVEAIPSCIEVLKWIRPQSCPNRLIINYADQLLGCGGKLFKASEEVVQKFLLTARGG